MGLPQDELGPVDDAQMAAALEAEDDAFAFVEEEVPDAPLAPDLDAGAPPSVPTSLTALIGRHPARSSPR